MDNNTNEPSSQNSPMGKMLIPAVVIGLLVFATVAYFALGMNQNKSTSTTQPTPDSAMQATSVPSPTSGTPVTGTEGAATSSEFKDGTYTATGNYVSPGGPRNVDVSITLKDGVITAADFTGHATDPNSKRFQGEFKDNFKPLVVGKSLDEVSLTKVAGSSLSPKGFMDALDEIKSESQA
jgi:uncharacterized protein with FMN-binding domain